MTASAQDFSICLGNPAFKKWFKSVSLLNFDFFGQRQSEFSRSTKPSHTKRQQQHEKKKENIFCSNMCNTLEWFFVA